jgi:type I restriction enzyme M protein
MRKSLGNKRNEISAEQIAEITRLYAEFIEGERVKILPNEAFGFMRATVERPLKVKWVLNEETAAGFAKTKAWKTFSPSVGNLDAEDFFGVPGPFDFLMWSPWDSSGAMSDALLRVRPDLPGDLMKEVLKAAAQGDPDGVLVTDKKGRPQPDPDLRDNENVPLPDVAVTWETDVTDRLETPAYRAAVDEYIAAEVVPYIADAWVDYDKTKVGYEIPLTRHFYKYVPPRPLAEIDEEIKQLEDEIQVLLSEVTE